MIDWDDAFVNSVHVPQEERDPDAWAEIAASFRGARPDGTFETLTYGTKERNQLDLFRPEGEARGLVVFVHGGYWHSLHRSYWSHLAQGALAAGWAVAIPGYTLAPEARIAEITREVAAAINCAAGAVAGPVRLIGHSAGGHLVARMACTDVPLDADVSARIERIIPLSGVFDLTPLLAIKMNDKLRLTAEEAAAESPARLERRGEIPILLWVGANERPEFLRQTRLMSEAWRPGGRPLPQRYDEGKNHFTVVTQLADPDSPLTRALVD
ncbi:alpha/beta hydrolase [Acuticoccus sp. MNP-M23]|uniref:alpha/beta hydrolase n=1 Tax=Acuticoccus sp. MNP-M23 TaxID=3072793 RepID=UPI0028163A3D|nr:alpha/beta hydrolase [Acuticoccus sp. MNP-M23]WMS42365.1 alpha/beta hydrolase [Acuticoccus sp. MNP-M23]